jgi:hypothetical protein
VERAERFVLLIDGDAYFCAIRCSLMQARRRIAFVVGIGIIFCGTVDVLRRIVLRPIGSRARRFGKGL